MAYNINCPGEFITSLFFRLNIYFQRKRNTIYLQRLRTGDHLFHAQMTWLNCPSTFHQMILFAAFEKLLLNVFLPVSRLRCQVILGDDSAKAALVDSELEMIKNNDIV